MKFNRTKVVDFFKSQKPDFSSISKRILQSIFRYNWPRNKFRGWRNVGFSKFFIKGASTLSVSILCNKFKLKWWKTVQYRESYTKRYSSNKGKCLFQLIDMNKYYLQVFYYVSLIFFLMINWQSNLLFYLSRIYHKKFCAISLWKN